MDYLLIEVFVEYPLGIFFLLLRLFARWWTAGFRSFDLGDAFNGAAIIFFTLEISGLYLLYTYGNNVGLTEKTAMQIPDSEVPRLEFGSKMLFLAWMWYMTFIWCLKGILMTLYWKMATQVDRQELRVKLMSGLCVVTYLACIITHLSICTPPSKSWQIKPFPGENCTARKPNYLVMVMMNALTDLGIILLPMPLLFNVRLPLGRKLLLGSIFSLGFFVIIATILRCYYSLNSLEDLPIALQWASRESFAACIAATAPGIKPLFSRSRWLKGSSATPDPGQEASGQSKPRFGEFGSDPGRRKGSKQVITFSHRRNSIILDDTDGFEMTTRKRPNQRTRPLSSGESDERVIIGNDSEDGKDIVVTSEFTVLHDDPQTPHERDRLEHRLNYPTQYHELS